MLTKNDYHVACTTIGVTPLAYNDYLNYEKLWNDYIAKIVIHYVSDIKPCCVRLVICESCPILPEGSKHPHPEYIFNNLMDKANPYLYQIWRGIYHSKQPNISKHKALSELMNNADGSVIILDLLPTHGISLTSANRKKVNDNPSISSDIGKITSLVNTLTKYCDQKELTVLGTFATPPSLNTSILAKVISTTKSSNLKYKWILPTINAGQGRIPSWRELANRVQGFRC